MEPKREKMPQVATKKRNGILNKDLKPIVYNVSIPGDVDPRLKRYRKDKGFTNEQEVIRVALANFLNAQGY